VIISLNGEQKEIPEGLTIRGLLELLNIRHQRVAVELNETIIKKDRYEETAVRDGDVLEVVSFMGGGQEMPNAEEVGISEFAEEEIEKVRSSEK
jgi:sulfur carrier protein